MVLQSQPAVIPVPYASRHLPFRVNISSLTLSPPTAFACSPILPLLQWPRFLSQVSDGSRWGSLPPVTPAHLAARAAAAAGSLDRGRDSSNHLIESCFPGWRGLARLTPSAPNRSPVKQARTHRLPFRVSGTEGANAGDAGPWPTPCAFGVVAFSVRKYSVSCSRGEQQPGA